MSDSPTPQTIEKEGQRLFDKKQYREAAERFSEAHRAYAVIGDESKMADMLNNAGVAYRRARKHKLAAEALEQARQMIVRLGDQGREAQVLGNLGGLYSKMKRYDESEACFQAAVDLFNKLDDQSRQAETLRAMAIMQFKRGQRSTAVMTYEQAIRTLPNPTFLQRFVRFILKVRSFLLNLPFLR